jgi:tetratricopeptide (TPR) repeat protein
VKPKNIFAQFIAMLVTVALVGTHADMALAADVNIARAKKHFKQGQVHYANGEYSGALEQFEAAYSYKKLPGFLFNMGQCHMEMKHFDMALKRYNQYLRESPKARNRAKVEDLMRQATAAKTVLAKKVMTKQPAVQKSKAMSKPIVAKKQTVKKVQVKSKPALAKAKIAKKPTGSVIKVIQATLLDNIPLAPLVVPIQDPALIALTPSTGLVNTMSEEPDSIYESWWFWSIATSVVAASISAVVLTQNSPTQQMVAPSGTLGTIDRR